MTSAEQLGESPGGEALAPELSADPVAHQALAAPVEDQEVAGDLTLEEDRLLHRGVVGEDLLPVGREGFFVPGRHLGHVQRFRVSLVLEEDRDVGFGYVADHAHARSFPDAPDVCPSSRSTSSSHSR